MRMRARVGAAAVIVALCGSILWAAPAGAAEVAVAAANFAFDPQVVRVQSGDTVTWTNTDPEPHTVSADDGSFSMVLDPGTSVSRTFNAEGTVPYYCKLHGGPGGEGMSGVVQVGDVTPPATVRVAVGDNVARAVSWSKLNHPDGAGFALVGRSDGFADSLASGAAQGKLDAPLLLTGTAALDARTKAELDRLGARVVYILGGTSAVSPAVESSLVAAGFTVRRVAGPDRLATATAVAETFLPEATSAIVVRGYGDGADPTRAFVDSLAAGAMAAATGQPVLFSTTASLSATTKDYIESRGISATTAIGGTAALADQVLTDLEAAGAPAERVAGLSRADTAAAVSSGIESAEEEGRATVLVDGTSADGWVDGFAAAGRGQPILLTSGDGVPGPTARSIAYTDELVGIVCGSTVTSTACSRAESVRAAEIDFPQLGAFVEGVDGTAAVGLYRTGDGTSLCADFFGTGTEIAGAHVRRASDGTPVITLSLEPSASNDPFGCTFGIPAATVADVLANPGDYEVTIETVQAPDGALVGPVTNLDIFGIAGLFGESEVPGPGDVDAAGFAFAVATDTPGQLCVGVFAFGLSAPATAAHIHEGPPDRAGPVVVTLDTPGEGGSIACYDVGEALLNRIKADPPAFYVNVHTSAFPAGAIRGALHDPTP